MEILKTLFGGLWILCIFSGCSTMKVIDSWNADHFAKSRHQQILIASQSDDPKITELLEKLIAQKLKGVGIEAMPFHAVFPNFNPVNEPNQEEEKKIIDTFLEAGYSTIMVTSLKDSIETRFLDKKATVSIASLSEKQPTEETLRIMRSTNYILQSLTYDLTQEKENILAQVCQVDVIDPKSSDQVLKQFAKILARQFNLKQ